MPSGLDRLLIRIIGRYVGTTAIRSAGMQNGLTTPARCRPTKTAARVANLSFMAIYLCRWPNGDFSIVSANTKSDAIELLDEWGNAEQASLKRMPHCMFDFRLNDDGQIELADIGEATHQHIMEACYPELDKAFTTAELNKSGLGYSANGQENIRKAVALERTRLWESQPPTKDAQTEAGREVQEQTGAASVVVDRIVREAAKKRLQSKGGEGKKPN